MNFFLLFPIVKLYIHIHILYNIILLFKLIITMSKMSFSVLQLMYLFITLYLLYILYLSFLQATFTIFFFNNSYINMLSTPDSL